MRRLSLVGLLLSISCARHGTRDPAHDGFCDGMGKVAFSFKDEPTADAAGCSPVHAYGTDSSGKPLPVEVVTYCCPK